MRKRRVAQISCCSGWTVSAGYFPLPATDLTVQCQSIHPACRCRTLHDYLGHTIAPFSTLGYCHYGSKLGTLGVQKEINPEEGETCIPGLHTKAHCVHLEKLTTNTATPCLSKFKSFGTDPCMQSLAR